MSNLITPFTRIIPAPEYNWVKQEPMEPNDKIRTVATHRLKKPHDLKEKKTREKPPVIISEMIVSPGNRPILNFSCTIDALGRTWIGKDQINLWYGDNNCRKKITADPRDPNDISMKKIIDESCDEVLETRCPNAKRDMKAYLDDLSVAATLEENAKISSILESLDAFF